MQLVEGPLPQHKLAAPPYALEALRDVGLVKRRMVMEGNVAEAHWYLAGEEGPLPPKRCDDPCLFDGMPDDEAFQCSGCTLTLECR